MNLRDVIRSHFGERRGNELIRLMGEDLSDEPAAIRAGKAMAALTFRRVTEMRWKKFPATRVELVNADPYPTCVIESGDGRQREGLTTMKTDVTPDAQDAPQWAIVEIFGHARYAGTISEHTIGGCSFVRVDIPEVDGEPAFTKLFGNAAIYSITPVSEQICRAVAKSFQSRPLTVYIEELEQATRRRRLGTGEEDDN